MACGTSEIVMSDALWRRSATSNTSDSAAVEGLGHVVGHVVAIYRDVAGDEERRMTTSGLLTTLEPRKQSRSIHWSPDQSDQE